MNCNFTPLGPQRETDELGDCWRVNLLFFVSLTLFSFFLILSGFAQM